MANIAVINDCQKDSIYHKSLNTSSEQLSSEPYTPELKYAK